MAPFIAYTRSLLRAGAAMGSGAVAAGAGSPAQGGAVAPIVAVTRPYLSKTRVGLACGHAATSLAKVKPERVSCEGCAKGWPTDQEVVEAAIAEATPEVRARLAALLTVPALPRTGGGAG
jgi:hypothetical protein